MTDSWSRSVAVCGVTPRASPTFAELRRRSPRRCSGRRGRTPGRVAGRPHHSSGTTAEAEPEWELSLPLAAWPTDTEYGEDEDVIAITVRLGNDGGPAQVLTLRPLALGGGALPGDAVAWHVVGRGDGVTTTFATRDAYVPASLAVRVDRQEVAASGIAAKDGPGRSFTLTDPPYGHPSEPDASAVVEARYARV